MKYQNKCPGCNRLATKKYGNVYFCERCAKIVRRRKATGVFKDILVDSLGQGCGIYTSSLVKIN